MRLAFAAATCVDPNILLLDEILAVGDQRFSRKCTAWMDDFRRRGKTTIMATHSTDAVTSQCDLALWLDRGRVAAFGDPFGVVRAYLQAKAGAPVAETVAPGTDGESLRSLIAGLLPLLRLPLIGYVRQHGTIKGGYEDGWTDGRLEFCVEPLREVSGWTVRISVPAGMNQENTVTLEVDGAPVAVAVAAPEGIELRCDRRLREGTPVRMRIVSSSTVNHHALGLSGDLRDVGVRLDEIVFEHTAEMSTSRQPK